MRKVVAYNRAIDQMVDSPDLTVRKVGEVMNGLRERVAIWLMDLGNGLHNRVTDLQDQMERWEVKWEDKESDDRQRIYDLEKIAKENRNLIENLRKKVEDEDERAGGAVLLAGWPHPSQFNRIAAA